MHTVLFVDDEVNILRALKRLFLDEDLRILTATSGEQALALLEDGERPSVIVSDQRMPGMDGADFLARAREISPTSMRMILTGYADIGAAVDAINLGQVHRYISKPWQDEELRLCINEAIDRFQLEQQNRQLTEDLQQANRQLAQINETLEEKVAERTQELQQAYDENLQLTRALRAQVRELQGWDRLQQHLLTIHSLEESLQVVAEVVTEVTAAAGVGIYLLEDQGAFQLALSHPDPMAWDEADLDRFLSAVLEENAPRLLEVPAVTTGTGFAAVALIPISKGTRKLGVLAVGGPSFAESMLHTLHNFSSVTATAILDARMNEALPDLEKSLDQILADLGA